MGPRSGFRSWPDARIISHRLRNPPGSQVLPDHLPDHSPDQLLPGHFPASGQPIDELALAEIKSAILAKLRLAIGKDAGVATRHDWYKAAALALRDRIVHPWLTAEKQSYDA